MDQTSSKPIPEDKYINISFEVHARGMSDETIRDLVKGIIAYAEREKSMVLSEYWIKRYNPDHGSPVFYIP